MRTERRTKRVSLGFSSAHFYYYHYYMKHVLCALDACNRRYIERICIVNCILCAIISHSALNERSLFCLRSLCKFKQEFIFISHLLCRRAQFIVMKTKAQCFHVNRTNEIENCRISSQKIHWMQCVSDTHSEKFRFRDFTLLKLDEWIYKTKKLCHLFDLEFV